jgi:hypothetical protein
MVTKVEIEKPRFFYAPPLNEYSAQSRILVRFRIQNNGTHPAINVVSSGRLLLSDGRLLEAASALAEVIPENLVHPPPTDSVGFMFVGDEKIEFIDALRRRGMRGKYPVLAVRTIFRNALGSCFAAESYFQLSIPNVAAESKLTDWHSLLVAFPVKYKAELEHLRKLCQKNHDEDELDKLFNIVKSSFDEQIKDLSNLELTHFGIPLSFKVEPLDDDAYETEVKVKYFGSAAPYRVDECFHSDE